MIRWLDDFDWVIEWGYRRYFIMEFFKINDIGIGRSGLC